MDRVRHLAQADLPKLYTYSQIARLVIISRHDLEKILPVNFNTSYPGSLRSLEELVQMASQILLANNLDTPSYPTGYLCPPHSPNTFNSDLTPLE